MSASLMRRTVVPGRAYAAIDIDSPGTVAVALAWQADDGWRVAVGGGRTVGQNLTQTKALHLMDRTAGRELDRLAARGLGGQL